MSAGLSRGGLVAILAAATIADMGAFILPFMVGTLADQYGVPAGEIGFLISAQIGLYALTALGIAPSLHKVDRRTVALIGVVTVVAGNLTAALAPGFMVLLFARMMAGLGEGLVMAAETAVVSGLPSPERVFAYLWLAVVTFSILISIVVPLLLGAGGASLTFFVMAGVASLLGLLLLFFPRHMSREAAPAQRIDLRSATSLRIAFAAGLFAIAANGAWMFVERIGHHHGLSVTQVGYTIMIASIVAITGPLATLALRDRLGRALPIGAMLALTGVGSMMTTQAATEAMFGAGVVLSAWCLVFGMPYLLGLAAVLDPTGRMATAVRALGYIGTAMTPSIGGILLLNGADYGVIGWTAVISVTLAGLLVISVAIRQDRRGQTLDNVVPVTT